MNVIICIIGIALVFGAVIQHFVRSWMASERGEAKISFTPALVIMIVGFALTLFAASIVIIPTGSTGVKTTFGQVDSRTLSAGFSWRIPFIQNVEEVNNKQQDISFDSQISAETEKRTTIYYNNIVVTYQLSTNKSAWLYSNVTDYKNLVTNNLVSSAVKSSSKTLSDEDATNRSKIEPLVKDYLQNGLDDKYEEDTVVINKVIIKDADFEESYNKAIADKQKATLQKQKQAIDNEKNIAKAEADATVKKTKAQAEADAELIKAQAKAKANKRLKESLTPEILQQLYLEKWDGKLPTYMTGENSSLLFNAGK